jgi:hypothetical protein
LDRLDRLTERLLENLDRQQQCLGWPLLDQLVSGNIDPPARERAEAHLDECLACLHRFLELRDHLHGLRAPDEVSPRLLAALDRLIGKESAGQSLAAGLAARLRRVLVFRVPAWSVAAAAAAIFITWMTVDNLRGPIRTVEWPAGVPDPTAPGRLTPADRQATRTVSGVVSAIRDATSGGVEAHVVSLEDAVGTTYVLFAWGRPTVSPGDAVEIEGIFTATSQSAGRPAYQGIATGLRKAK